MTSRPSVLFLCTHNAGRSLAAKVLLEHHAAGRVEVRSAGTDPATDLNPSVLAVLAERGLDVGAEHPKALTEADALAVDVIVTMGCGDRCPYYPAKRYLDWDLPDPAGLPVERVRPIVDDIDRRVRALVAELLGGSDSRSEVARVDLPAEAAGDAPAEVAIRPYRPADQPGLTALVASVLAEYGIDVDPDLDADLDRPDAFYGAVWVVTRSEAIVGSAAVRLLDDDTTAELKRMYLDPDLRGRGLGRTLLALAVDWARAHHRRGMVLETATTMTGAQRLYEAAGFTRTGRGTTDCRCAVAYRLDLPARR